MGDCQTRPTLIQEQEHMEINDSPNSFKFYSFWDCSYIQEESDQPHQRLEYDYRFLRRQIKISQAKLANAIKKQKRGRIRLEILKGKSISYQRNCLGNQIYIKIQYGEISLTTQTSKSILPAFNTIIEIKPLTKPFEEKIDFILLSSPGDEVIAKQSVQIKELEDEDVLEKYLSDLKMNIRGQLIYDHQKF